MSARLVINGKFLSAPMTGVHRVAHELANAIADLGSGAEVWHRRNEPKARARFDWHTAHFNWPRAAQRVLAVLDEVRSPDRAATRLPERAVT